jgi:hypothetical protein
MKSRIVFLLLLLLPGAATAFAQEDSGTCGKNLTWTLSNGTLTISGTGDMTDFSSSSSPWYSSRSSIATVIIGNGVTRIGNYAFYNCSSLATVTIPNSVTSIGIRAFSGCNSLIAINVDANNAVYSSENGVLFNKVKTTLVQYTTGKTDAGYTIPNSVTSIGISAFADCVSLTSVTIPEGVTSIEQEAFSFCENLASLTIPRSVTSIGAAVFNYCENLTSVTIPDGVTSIKAMTFWNCLSLTSINIPNSVTSIGDDAFNTCLSLTSVTIPKNMTSIGKQAFIQCFSLASVIIPNSVTSIGDYAFSACGLTSVTIGSSVTSIGKGAFAWCNSLTSVSNLNPAPQSIVPYVFDEVNIGDATLYVPAQSVALYKATAIWKDFGTITAYVPTAIDMPAATSAIRVYSNPATGSLHIEGLTVPAQVTVINTAGQTVWRQTVADGGSLSIGRLPKGVYLVHVNGQTMKIIK